MFRRRTAAVGAVLLLLPLAACGSGSDKKDGAATSSTLSAVSLSGSVGKSLKASWKKKMTPPKKASVTTLVKGTGPKIATGDTVATYLWVGNGTTKKEAYSDYAQGAAENIPYSAGMNEIFASLFKNATYGSRVATVTSGSDLLGEGQDGSRLGIAAKDAVVVVADFVKKAPTSPKPSDAKVHQAKPGSMPKVVITKGKPSGLDWSGVKKPSLRTPVQRQVLKQGKGATVKATDTITVDYLGETYKAKKPFDASYSRGQPLTTALSG